MIANEVEAKSVLTKSKLADYCVNPYSGCGHACAYCYVPRMPWNRGRCAKWGEEVNVKTNAAEVLGRELEKAKRGTAMLSSATDAWQPLEQKYGIARKCLEALAEKDFPVTVLTKSVLVVRDADVLKRFSEATVGLTITTDDEDVVAALEPNAPAPEKRVKALAELKAAGLSTYAFIGPLLPMNAEMLANSLAGKIGFAFIDRLNYATPALERLLEQRDWAECLSQAWATEKKQELTRLLTRRGIEVKPLF
ncbi:MAG: radical SAM protein [Candidatus Micrarchaeota archaeon]